MPAVSKNEQSIHSICATIVTNLNIACRKRWYLTHFRHIKIIMMIWNAFHCCGSPHKGPAMRNFYVLFVLGLSKLLIKQLSGTISGTPQCSWDVTVMVFKYQSDRHFPSLWNITENGHPGQIAWEVCSCQKQFNFAGLAAVKSSCLDHQKCTRVNGYWKIYGTALRTNKWNKKNRV